MTNQTVFANTDVFVLLTVLDPLATASKTRLTGIFTDKDKALAQAERTETYYQPALYRVPVDTIPDLFLDTSDRMIFGYRQREDGGWNYGRTSLADVPGHFFEEGEKARNKLTGNVVEVHRGDSSVALVYDAARNWSEVVNQTDLTAL